MAVADKFEGLMVDAGSIITEMPQEERQKWINALPDLTADWKSNSGPAAAGILAAYLSGMADLGYVSPRN